MTYTSRGAELHFPLPCTLTENTFTTLSNSYPLSSLIANTTQWGLAWQECGGYPVMSDSTTIITSLATTDTPPPETPDTSSPESHTISPPVTSSTTVTPRHSATALVSTTAPIPLEYSAATSESSSRGKAPATCLRCSFLTLCPSDYQHNIVPFL